MLFDDPELLAEFVVESNEHLADVENQLLKIESDGADIDEELVNTVFRAVHSVKGAAGFLGLGNIQDLSHNMESVLNRIRLGEVIPERPVIDVLLRAADALSALLNDTANSNHVDISERIEELNGIEAAARPVKHRPRSESAKPSSPLDATSSTSTSTSAASSSASPTNSATPAVETKPGRQEKGNQTSPPAIADANIRVSVATLDHLMNLAGELVLSRNRLLQHVSDHRAGDLVAISTSLDQITRDIHDAIMETRMQPIGCVFGRFTRVVRDLSARLGKECELMVSGMDVEVDKSIIEAIGDPLTHLIRNSIDHGIELPDVREQRGKPQCGVVRLSAYHQAGQVCIDIEDDGAGIDSQKMRASAIAKGLISEDEANQMSDRQALRLIFHPGFSTATQITDLSGRGVGMDVVLTNIEKLGGAVELDSEPEVGATIHITLPLTLAIISSLIVDCGGQCLAIPQVNIKEIVRVPGAERQQRIKTIKGAQVLRLRGDLLPLIETKNAIQLDAQNQSLNSHHSATCDLTDDDLAAPTNIVVVETGQIRYGLVVDQLEDSEEIVVKPLGRHLESCESLAGATILGDGRIALILDVSGIADKSGLNLAGGQNYESDSANLQAEETQKLLLFTHSPSEQFAVPMSLVARIERIESRQIETLGGKNVMNYRGGTLPLILLHEVWPLSDAPLPDRINVIVFESHSREIGLVAPIIGDMRDIGLDIDTSTLAAQGVVGSIVIDGDTTRLLDVFELVDMIEPDWLMKRDAAQDDLLDKPPRLMVVDDSEFFRNQVGGFLAKQGYQVVQAHDGLHAWEMLSGPNPCEVDLVITDVEMPRMNGLELSRKISLDAELRSIPVIALTSLAGEEDQLRGAASGVADYQVKMDRDHLLESVANTLAKAKQIAAAALTSPACEARR